MRMVLESVARIVKVQLPAYLKGLPVPESITGFARLTGNPHLHPLLLLVRSPRRRRGWGRGASKNPQAKGRGGARRVARDPVTLRRVGAAAEGRECCLLGPGGWAGRLGRVRVLTSAAGVRRCPPAGRPLLSRDVVSGALAHLTVATALCGCLSLIPAAVCQAEHSVSVRGI